MNNPLERSIYLDECHAQWDELMWFCRERQRIFERKSAGLPAPWTDDVTLQTKKFCNIFRDQDRLSVFIEDWIGGTDHILLNLLYARFACRQSILESGYLESWQPDKYIEYINSISGGKIYDKNGKPKSNRNPVWGCPYQVSSSFHKLGYRSREDMIINHLPKVSEALLDIVMDIKPGEDLQKSGCLARMKEVLGFGAEFVMIQVVLDMVMLGHVHSDITFPLGPGAKPILAIFEPLTGVSSNGLLHAICEDWNHGGTRRFMHPLDAEQALCEYRKYITWRDGKANGKIYKGGTG